MQRFQPRLMTIGILLSLSLAGCGLQNNQGGITGAVEPTAGPVEVTSPNGALHITVSTSPGGALEYSVTRGGQSIVETSPVGIIVDGDNLGAGVHILGKQIYGVDETYPTRAVHALATDRCNGARIEIAANASAKKWTLEARAYDTGVAFRYIVPGSGKRIPGEATSYCLPDNATVWVESVRGHYESVPMRMPVSDITAATFAAPPMTIAIPIGDHAIYAAITEAAVYNYPGSALQCDGKDRFAVRLAPVVAPSYPFTLRYGEAGVARITKPVPIEGTITSPWRVVMVAPDLNGLVNSDILTNLNPPPNRKLFPEGQKTPWIKPGRAVWSYLDGGRDTSPEGAKEFAQLGSLLHFQYNVIEGYWSRWTDDQLRDVCDYSKKRGIGVWVWLMSDPAHEIHRQAATRPTTQHASASPRAEGSSGASEDAGLLPWPNAPRVAGADSRQAVRNLDLRDRANRRKLFAHLHELGVVGVKIDFIDTEAQEAEVFYQQTLEDAAEAHLLVNFHGSSKPTGEQRTYPNELTREAVFGLEHRAYPTGTDAALVHTVLPFTRFLAGSADYTPVIFGPRRGNTTWTHQVATAVVFTSALQTYAAHPGNILATPAAEMISLIPATWDETRVLAGSEIGKVAAYARRSGNAWFVGVVNGDKETDLTIPLSFLGDGSYSAELLHDVENKPAAIDLATVPMGRENSIQLHLAPGGGFVARFSKE